MAHLDHWESSSPNEKGVNLNWPWKDATDDFDLKIDKDNPWIQAEG